MKKVHQQGKMNCPVLAHPQLGWEMRSFANSCAARALGALSVHGPTGQFRVLGRWDEHGHGITQIVVEQ